MAGTFGVSVLTPLSEQLEIDNAMCDVLDLAAGEWQVVYAGTADSVWDRRQTMTFSKGAHHDNQTEHTIQRPTASHCMAASSLGQRA